MLCDYKNIVNVRVESFSPNKLLPSITPKSETQNSCRIYIRIGGCCGKLYCELLAGGSQIGSKSVVVLKKGESKSKANCHS